MALEVCLLVFVEAACDALSSRCCTMFIYHLEAGRLRIALPMLEVLELEAHVIFPVPSSLGRLLLE